jgi:hypothetical protein
MKTKCTIGILLTILIGVAMSMMMAQRRAARAASPIRIDQANVAQVLPAGNCCLWRLHKKATGLNNRQVQYGLPYNCPTGQTKRGQTIITFILNTEGRLCDQSLGVIPNNSRLEATGDTIRRADGFAHFSGKFVIKNPAGVELFQGTMDVIDRIGTHHPPYGAEACNQYPHLEGWLEGRGSQQLPNHTLRALIVARADLPQNSGSATLNASIDGTLIKCP